MDEGGQGGVVVLDGGKELCHLVEVPRHLTSAEKVSLKTENARHKNDMANTIPGPLRVS